MLRRARRLMKGRRGAVIGECALVVPLLMIIVFGIIDFSRAYAQLNNINSSLREGARFGAAQKDPTVAGIKAEITRFSSAWANPLDVSKVNVNIGAQNLFDKTPGDNPWGGIAGAKYPVHSPYGFNGGFYYARVGYTW